MHIPDDMMSHKFSDTFDALSDHRGTQVSDMKRLRNVWAAVINDDCFRLLCLFTAETRICIHVIHELCDKRVAEF